MKRKTPKTYDAKFQGRTVRVTVPERDGDDAPSDATDDRIKSHPMYSPSDLTYFRNKGYSDQEIAKILSGNFLRVMKAVTDAAGRESARERT